MICCNYNRRVCVCVRASVRASMFCLYVLCACVRACERACVRACVRACLRACVVFLLFFHLTCTFNKHKRHKPTFVLPHHAHFTHFKTYKQPTRRPKAEVQQQWDMQCCCCRRLLCAYRPSNIPYCQRDGSDQTTVRAATLTQVSDQTRNPTQSQYTDNGPTGPSAGPATPGARKGNRWSTSFKSLV